MESSYKPLPQNVDDLSCTSDAEYGYRKRRINRAYLWVIIAVLGLANVTLLSFQYLPNRHSLPPPDFALTDNFDTTWQRFWWNTAYSSSNRTHNDMYWDNILPSHGIIAVDKKWARGKGWPDSLSLPSDHSKATYLLEAYHQLHCLRILRKTFWEAIDGVPYTYHPSAHMEHCFDTLRQSVQCNADNTPLYSFGDFTAGDGQMHQCRDWKQLQNWATKHTACYRDSVEGIPLKEHFGFCDDGDDGVGAIDEGVSIA